MKNLKIDVSAPYVFSFKKAEPDNPLDEPIKTDYDVGRERLDLQVPLEKENLNRRMQYELR